MKAVMLVTNVLIVAVALVVTSCGSSGGGGGGTYSVGVSITQANAKDVAATAVNSVDTAQGLSSGASVLTGVSINATSGDFNFPDFIVSQLNRVAGSPGLLNYGSLTGASFSGTTQCTDIGGTSGTVTESGTVSVPNELNVGDTVTLVFNNCDLPDATINGTMSMMITQVSGDILFSTTFTLGVNVTLTSLSISDGVAVIMGNGDMSMLLDENGSTGNSRMVLSGNSLTATEGSSSETLTAYNFDFTGDFSGNFIASLAGTISSSSLGGTVSFISTTDFTGNDNVLNGDPTAGVLLITTNADSSQEWLTALADATVKLEVDEDGDGTVDVTVMTTWSELSAI